MHSQHIFKYKIKIFFNCMPTNYIRSLIGDVNDIYNREFYIDNNINIVINYTKTRFLDLPHLKKVEYHYPMF